MQASWPKDGVVLVFCKGGKYWADPVTDDLSNANEVLADLKDQAAKAERKESLARLCKDHMRKKFAALN